MSFGIYKYEHETFGPCMMLLYDPECQQDKQEYRSNIQQLKPQYQVQQERKSNAVSSRKKSESKGKETKQPRLPSVEFRDGQFIKGTSVVGSPSNYVRSIPKLPNSHHHPPHPQYHSSLSRSKFFSEKQPH